MDLSKNLSTTDSNCKDENGSMNAPAKRFYFSPPTFRQNWSFPDSIVYYITMTPSSTKGYQKMIQSCKYFFNKNPIIVCSDLSFCRGEDDTSKIAIGKDEEKKFIDLKNVSQKFWITDVISIFTEKTGQRNVISSFIPHIYKSDIKNLNLRSQFISFNELSFLASKADYIFLCECAVKGKEGSVVPVEKIIEACVQVKIFEIYFDDNDQSITSKTAENFLKISHISSIKKIFLNDISEVFDIETFYIYMKKNKHTRFYLTFDDSISDAYKNRLEEIVDEILATKNHDYKPPYIDFVGLGLEKCNELYRISSMF